MKSGLRGTRTLQNQVTNINSLGLWLLVEDHEYFVPFDDYPVFKTATIDQILNFRRIGPRQYHWPHLDADIELDALDHPERFPLMYR
ncbi:MAG: DUF2442 domain-containing protein [Chloroflexi bacterium]|nr:DUF2442 domain-containing protein [Chloroflexota bacterium]